MRYRKTCITPCADLAGVAVKTNLGIPPPRPCPPTCVPAQDLACIICYGGSISSHTKFDCTDKNSENDLSKIPHHVYMPSMNTSTRLIVLSDLRACGQAGFAFDADQTNSAESSSISERGDLENGEIIKPAKQSIGAMTEKPINKPAIKTLETDGKPRQEAQSAGAPTHKSFEDKPITKPTLDKLFEESVRRIIGFLQETGATSLVKILYFVGKEIPPYFDFEHMTCLSLGRLMRDVSLAQFCRIQEKIQASFTESIAQHLVNYSFTKRQVDFLPPLKSPHSQMVTLQMRARHPKRRDSSLLFKFHRTPNGWKIFDALANG